MMQKLLQGFWKMKSFVGLAYQSTFSLTMVLSEQLNLISYVKITGLYTNTLHHNGVSVTVWLKG